MALAVTDDDAKEMLAYSLALQNKDCQPVFVVSDDATCFDIAQSAGISLETFVQNNPNVGTDTDCTVYPNLVGRGFPTC